MSKGIYVWILQRKGRQDRVAETAFVVVLDIDDLLLILEELGKLLIADPFKRVELRYFKGDRVDLGEDQSRFFPD